FKLTGVTLLATYLLGIVVALLMAWLFKKTLLKGETPMLIMELPPYKRPLVRVVVRHMWDRSKIFLRRAGTVILGINILLWFLATYPKHAEITKQTDARKIELTKSIFPDIQDNAELEKKAAELPDYRMLRAGAVTDVPAGTRAIVSPSDATNLTFGTLLSPSQVKAFEEIQNLDKQAAGEHLRKS